MKDYILRLFPATTLITVSGGHSVGVYMCMSMCVSLMLWCKDTKVLGFCPWAVLV